MAAGSGSPKTAPAHSKPRQGAAYETTNPRMHRGEAVVPSLAGPGRMTREEMAVVLGSGVGQGLTGVSKEKAHSSLWTRSPALGTRIVGNTDSSASSLSSAMTPAAAPPHTQHTTAPTVPSCPAFCALPANERVPYAHAPKGGGAGTTVCFPGLCLLHSACPEPIKSPSRAIEASKNQSCSSKPARMERRSRGLGPEFGL